MNSKFERSGFYIGAAIFFGAVLFILLAPYLGLFSSSHQGMDEHPSRRPIWEEPQTSAPDEDNELSREDLEKDDYGQN